MVVPKMTKRTKRPGGRPTLYRRECCDQIVEAMATGLSAEAAAAKIGISARSLFYWQRQHPEFLQAIQEGRQKCLLFWEERALEMAGGSPGNSQMVILALKNRSRAAYGWHHDSQRVEHSGPDGAPVAIETSTRNTIDVSRMSVEDRVALRGILMRVGECNVDRLRIGQDNE
jgi:transposase-like protein